MNEYSVLGPYYNCPSPYGRPHASMENYKYYVQGKGGTRVITNYVQRGDYALCNKWGTGSAYYKRLGNAIRAAIRDIERGEDNEA